VERTIIPPKSTDDQSRLYEHIFSEGMGVPIIFDAAPTLEQMQGNTWGKFGTNIYIKFSNNTGLVISGTNLT